MIETNATRARDDNKKLFHLRLQVPLLFLLLLPTSTPPSCLSAAATPSSFALYLLPGKKIIVVWESSFCPTYGQLFGPGMVYELLIKCAANETDVERNKAAYRSVY